MCKLFSGFPLILYEHIVNILLVIKDLQCCFFSGIWFFFSKYAYIDCERVGDRDASRLESICIIGGYKVIQACYTAIENVLYEPHFPHGDEYSPERLHYIKRGHFQGRLWTHRCIMM